MYVSSIGPDGGGKIYVLVNHGTDLLTGWTSAGPLTYADGSPLLNYDAQPFVHSNGNHYMSVLAVSLYFTMYADLYLFLGSFLLFIRCSECAMTQDPRKLAKQPDAYQYFPIDELHDTGTAKSGYVGVRQSERLVRRRGSRILYSGHHVERLLE
jgi:hypothetical protein